MKTIQTHFAPAFCIYFDQREERFFSAGDDGIIRVFSLKRGQLICTLRGHVSQLCDLSIDATNGYLASGSIDGHICVWDLVGYQLLVSFNNGSSILNLDFHPDPSLGDRPILMSSGGDGQVKYYALDLQMGTVHQPPLSFQCKSLARDEVRCVAFSPGGHRLIAGATDGLVRLLRTPCRTDIIQEQPMPNSVPHIQLLEEHAGCITACCFPEQADLLEFITGYLKPDSNA